LKVTKIGQPLVTMLHIPLMVKTI